MDAASLFQSLTSKPEAPASNIITGTAVGSSEDGMVLVQVDGSAVAQPSDEEVSLTIPTDEFAGGSYQLPSAPYPGTVVLTDDNDNVVDEDDYYIDGDQLTIEALDLPPVEIAYDTEVRQALTNDDFASGSITVDSTTNLTLLEDMGGADWQPCAYTLDGNELTVAGIETQQGLVEFVYVRSVSLVCETGLNVLPDMPDPDDVAVTGRINNTDYVVTSWTLDQDQLTLPSGYDAFVVDYIINETEQWNITEQYLDEPLQDSDEAADPAIVTVGHDLQYEPDSVTSCTVDGVSATYTLDGVNVVADSPSVTERYFTLTYDAPVTLEVPASEFAVSSYTLPSEPTGAVVTTSNGSTLANSVSGLELSVPSLIATSASYTIAYTAQVESDVVELPCTPAVSEGQFVDIAIVNGMPSVIGASGSGDAVAAAADAAEAAATAAEAVANAVNQHFWTDGSGVHVTEVKQEEWLDPLSPNYESGANQLSNSAGILLRDGLTNLSQFTPGAFAVYDGSGNGAANIVALLSSDTLSVGSGADYNFQVTGGSLKLAAGSSSLFAVTDNSGATTIDVGTAEFYGTAELNSLKALFNGSGFYVASASVGAKILNQNGFESGYSLSTYYNDGYFEIVDRFGHQVCSLYAELDYWPGAVVKFDTQSYLYPPEDPPEGPAVVNIGGTKIKAEDGAINITADAVSIGGNVSVAGKVIASNLGTSYGGNLDSLKTNGLYYCSTASTNGPIASTAGECVVASSTTEANVVQLFITYSAYPSMWVRRYYSGAWGAWQVMADRRSKTITQSVQVGTFFYRASSYVEINIPITNPNDQYTSVAATNLPASISCRDITSPSTLVTITLSDINSQTVQHGYVALRINCSGGTSTHTYVVSTSFNVTLDLS